jgi:hypothetical protein
MSSGHVGSFALCGLHMTRPCQLIAITAILACVGSDGRWVLCTACAAEQLADSVAPIASAWAKREAAIRTVKLVWHHQTTRVGLKERLAAASAGKGRPVKDAWKGKEPSLTTYDTHSTLFLDGDYYAVTQDIDDSQADGLVVGGAGIAQHTKRFLKGDESGYFSSKLPGGRYDTGVLAHRKDFNQADLPDIRPLMLALRPLTPKLGDIDLQKYRVSATRPVLRGSSCLVLERIDDDTFRRSFWVDPARDFIILREVVSDQGHEVARTDVAYTQNPSHFWIPQDWDVVIVRRQTGKLVLSIHGVAQTVAINAPIASKEFSLSFPDGTYVYDQSGDHLIERLVGAEPLAAASTGSNRFWLIAGVNLVALMCVIAYLVIRGRQSSA